MRRLVGRVPPALILFFLPPAIAELLSGSAPPSEFFSPLTLALLCALYGSGAVLCRELVRHWGKGGTSLLALGAAYGMLEEGLMVKSFFDPQWMDLGALGVYGRWAGVNWVWAGSLTVYHAVFSIAIPVVLVELAFPDRRSDRWVGRRGVWVLTALLSAVCLVGFLFLTPYRPPALPCLACLLGVGGLVLLARRLGEPATPALARPHSRPAEFWLLGLGATLGLFAVTWAVPATGTPPAIALVLLAGVVGLAGSALRRAVRRGGALPPGRQMALVSGALTFFIVLAPLQELDRSRSDDPAGMALVGLGALAALVVLALRIRLRSAVATPPASAA